MKKKIGMFLENHFLPVYFLLQFIRKRRFISHRFFHRRELFKFSVKVVKGVKPRDIELVSRLCKSYIERSVETPTSQWLEIFKDRHSDVHSLICNKDYETLAKYISNPVDNDLMYGFDDMTKTLNTKLRIETKINPNNAFDALISLAEALGATNVSNPEDYCTIFPKKREIYDILEKVIDYLNMKNLTHPIFPNVFNGERGIATKYGVISYRAPLALYQAQRALQFGKHICEIGPGLGRTAYYAMLLGAERYTLVDIPISSFVQGGFLGDMFDKEDLGLSSEDWQSKKIQIISPSQFFESHQKYDVIINVDSLTEIGQETARDYIDHIKHCSKTFISINHERNEFTVNGIMTDNSDFQLLQKSRCWIRRGYVEEIYRIIN